MEIWLIAALLSALTVLALVKGPAWFASGGKGSPHLAVYKAQLAELDRELARGTVNEAEIQSQKTEVARRLLAAARETETGREGHNRKAFWIAIALVPVVAFALYADYGVPRLPDVPQAARLANAEAANDLDALVYKVERHLAENPDDAQGWTLLLPFYQSLARYRPLAIAYENLIRIGGPTADLQAGLAEALTLGNGGLLTPEAEKAAAAALALDPRHPKARYFMALGFSQNGEREKARAAFRALLADSPADAPWRASVEGQLQRLDAAEGQVAAPTQEQAAAVLEQSEGGQQAMIRGMVEGLAARLAGDPSDLEGWLRLIRARTVLQEQELARQALDQARRAFAGNPAALERIEGLAREVRLQ
jgi:cytochrome c-type biogenesis protein CcmH